LLGWAIPKVQIGALVNEEEEEEEDDAASFSFFFHAQTH
jgi:hypothetical protein